MTKIRLSKSSISELEINFVTEVLKKEYLGMGVETQNFENELSEYLGISSNNIATVNTGTSALHIALSAIGISVGDEVLVPSLTYVASFQAISALGATPVACEVIPNTLFIDPVDAESKLSTRTKAIMPVHYGSSCKGIKEIYDLAAKYGLRVIEDAAQAFGSTYDGKKIGSFGDIICFSFDGIKNITCGEGGVVISPDANFIEKIRDSRLLGVKKDTENRYAGKRSWDFDVDEQGFRYHLSNINAAIGRAQLSRINEFKSKRQFIATKYTQNLSHINEIKLLDFDYTEVMPHIFVIIANDRDLLRDYLISKEIEVGVHYKPNHLLSKYKSAVKLPITEILYSKILTLPCHFDLKISEQEYVIKSIFDFYEK